MRIRLLLITSLFFALTAAAEPPARVVRLNLTNGVVSFRPAGIDDWTDATINRPLIDGDELWTDESARAEMHIGSAAVRLGGATSFGIVSETDQVAQLRLSSGTMNVRVRRVDDDDVWEIDTPNAVVSLLRAGRYRIDVSDDGLTTTVTTRGGEAEVTAGDSAFAVRAGEQAQISGDSDLTHDIDTAPSADAFDRWCGDRDLREERVASLHYVPADMVGYEDLDANGRWRFIADYGWVWSPTYVVAGWAPYRYGHWAWVAPWGWTWIDDAPWGFAPFHYGRWAYDDGAWFWVPGRIVRPVYAPALVVFGGSGFHAGISVGTVAWWPLAPGEAYVPSYRVSDAYVRNINAPFVRGGNINVNVTNVQYRNQRVAGGVTAISEAAFVGAKPVSAARVSITPSQAIAVRPIGTSAPVAPATATSILGGTTRANWAAPRPPQAIAARPVVTRTSPLAPSTVQVPSRNGDAQRQIRPTAPVLETPKEKLRVATPQTPPPSRPVTWNPTPAPATPKTSAPPWQSATPRPVVTPPSPTPSTATPRTSAPPWQSATPRPVVTPPSPTPSTTTSTPDRGARKETPPPPKKEKEKKAEEPKKGERHGEKKD